MTIRAIEADVLERLAREYLMGFPGVTSGLIDAHLFVWKGLKPTSISGLYRSMVAHATNRQMMPKVIGQVDRFADVLCQFDPGAVAARYEENSKDILREIKSRKIPTAGKVALGNTRGLWAQFARSALSSARFVSRFRSVDEFDAFVKAFYVNEHSKLALPLLLSEEIDGYGFALACDFLKESGYPEFVKPDTHIKDLAKAAQISLGRSGYEVFKDVIAYCQKNKRIPYELDKLLWLVGSGNFYLAKFQVRTKKKEFEKLLRRACAAS